MSGIGLGGPPEPQIAGPLEGEASQIPLGQLAIVPALHCKFQTVPALHLKGGIVADKRVGERIPIHPVGDLHPFVHHPDRFLLTYLILVVIQGILQIPVTIASRMYANAFLQQTLTLDSAFSYLSFVLLCSSVSTLVYVILTLRFVMATYLLLDYDEIGGIQALKESSRMMRGQKGRYFYVTISFFGVMALSVLTCGIGMLWVMPYMETTLAFFYRDLAGEV